MIEIENITPTSVNKTEVVKDNNKIVHIQKNNLLMLGFLTWSELINKLIGIKQSVFTFLIATITVITTFIQNYVWDDAKAIYFMLFLIAFDASTGILKSIKFKTFSSSRLPRILVIMVIYTSLLAISWNISKFSPFYYWLPGALYGGFLATLIVSIFENLHELKIIPERLYSAIKSKLDALQTLILGKNKGKGKK